MPRPIIYRVCRSFCHPFIGTLIQWSLLILVATLMGCSEKAQGAPGEVQTLQKLRDEKAVVDQNELGNLLADIAKLKAAWASGDDSKVLEICGTANLGDNLNSRGFVARKALASTSKPKVLLQYKVARVPVSTSKNSVVYATYVSFDGSWAFLNFATDPKFALAAFGPVTVDADEIDLLNDATDRAVNRFLNTGDTSDNAGLKGVPFFAATDRVTQPNVQNLGKAMEGWDRQSSEIRVCRRVYVEVAVGEQAAYPDPFFAENVLGIVPAQTVVLGFSDHNGKLCCVEGLRQLRLMMSPFNDECLKFQKGKVDTDVASVISRLCSASDLCEGLGPVNSFSAAQMKTIVPFAMKAYQQRQRVYKNESRMEISKLLGLCGEHSKAALPLLAEELNATVLAESKVLFDVTLDSMSQIVGNTAVIQRLRKTQDLKAWNALVKLFDCDRILKEDDFDRLVELLETDDLQEIESKLNEIAKGRVSRRKRSQIQTALAFVRE